jgi:hypothetical protein
VKALLVLALLVFAPCAWAADGDAKQRAAERFEAARALFARGEYAKAAETFEQAAAIAPHPAAYMDAAEAWERAGEPVRAAEVCDRLVAMPYLDARYAGAANAILRRNAAKIATLDVVAPTGARASVDGGAELSVPHRWRLAPGTHALVVVDAGKARSSSLALKGGESRVVDASPPPPEPPPPPPRPVVHDEPPPPPPPPESSGPPAGAWIAFGVAAAAVGVGATFGVMTLMSRDDYNAVPNHATADAFYRNRAIADVGLFTGLAAAGVGVAILVFSSGKARPASVGRVEF